MWLRRSIPTFLLAALMAYFGYHGLSGEQGMVSWMSYERRIVVLEAELAAVQTERLALERRAALLDPQGLDADYLDERARALLGFARSEEFLVSLND